MKKNEKKTKPKNEKKNEAKNEIAEEIPNEELKKDYPQETAPKERLNKFIAANGIFSRRKIDEFILEGRVTVNNKEVFDLGTKINPLTDKVFIDGERVRVTDKKIYLMMNKPMNVITSVSDEKKRPTVIDIVNMQSKVFPVGRLDFHTTGLLILTNDGDFANKLMNPAFKVWKTYEAKLSRPLEQKHRLLLEKGIKLDGVYTLPAIVNVPNERDYTEVVISISQGKNRQVRRMFENFGYFVNKLHRSGYGSLKLGNLHEGEFRKMTKEEVDSLITKQPAPKSDSEEKLKEKLSKDKFEKSTEKGIKRNYTRGPKENKRPLKDFKKKFSKDKGEPKEYKKEFKKDFVKKFSNDDRETERQTEPKKDFKDFKKKFTGNARSYKGGKKFSDIPKESLREDNYYKDAKHDFKKKFSEDVPKKFSKSNFSNNSRSRDSKPDFEKKFSKDSRGKDSKPFEKKFSKEGADKFSKDSRGKDSKPDFKKKFASKKTSSGSKKFKSGFNKKFR